MAKSWHPAHEPVLLREASMRVSKGFRALGMVILALLALCLVLGFPDKGLADREYIPSLWMLFGTGSLIGILFVAQPWTWRRRPRR